MKTQIFAATALALLLATQPVEAQTSTGSSGTGSSATGSSSGTGSSGMGSGTTTPGTNRATPGADTGSVGGFGAGTGTNIDATGESLGSPSFGNLAAETMPSNMNSGAFGTYARGRWDLNGDGIVTSREWNDITPSWFGPRGDASMRNMSTWDTNHSGDLDPTELQNVFSNSGLYQLYDLNNDGVIDSGEAGRIPLR